MLDDIFMTMSTSTGMYPKLDLWTANKLQLQLQLYWPRPEPLATLTAVYNFSSPVI